VEHVDGHDIEEIAEVLGGVGLDDKPLVIIAKTYKGAGVSFLQDMDGWHGKPLNKEESRKAIAELSPTAKIRPRGRDSRAHPAARAEQRRFRELPVHQLHSRRQDRHARSLRCRASSASAMRTSASLPWMVTPKNSTFADKFSRKYPNRSTECYIAEQNLVATAIGFGTRARCRSLPPSRPFLPAAADQIRVAGISQSNLKLVGSHVGGQHRRGRSVADGAGRPGH